MRSKTYVGWIAGVTLMVCAFVVYAEDSRQPPKIVNVEPVQARIEVLGCGGPSISLNLPKWKCAEDHHGEVISAYRVTYVRGSRKFVTVLPYRPDENSEPIEVDETVAQVKAVLHEIN